jgi:hypothetical protein
LIHVQASIFQERNFYKRKNKAGAGFPTPVFSYLHLNDAQTVSQLSDAHMPDMSMWSATQRLSVLWTQFAALHLISNVSFGLATAFLKELPLFSLKSPQHVQSVVSAAFP